MKYLIVGLGNIGEEYCGTRHNIGFRVVNQLAQEIGTTFTERRYGAIAKGRVKNVELVLLKPSTYMNLSGEAVRYWMIQEKIPLDRLLIVVDDLALPYGNIRLKPQGSDAGHNGLKNIALLLNTIKYPRLRFGIGNDFGRGKQVDFVLGQFNEDELSQIKKHINRASDAIKCFCLEGLTRAMNQYNQ